MCGRARRDIFIQTGLGHGGYGFSGSPCGGCCIPYGHNSLGGLHHGGLFNFFDRF